MTRSTKALLVGAAVAGLISGGTVRLQAAATPSMVGQSSIQSSTMGETETDKHACKGHNSCKGTGGCKSGNNGCKGKNDCKGKGGCATDGSKK